MISTSLTCDVSVGKSLDFTSWSISSNQLSFVGRFGTITTSGRYKTKIFYPDGTFTEDYYATSYNTTLSNQSIPIGSIRTNESAPSSPGVYQWRIYIYDLDHTDVVLFDATISVGINEIEKETVFVGEYDYTEYFENLVAGQNNQTTLLTNVKNEVLGLADTVSSNHLLLFSAFLLGVGVLVRKILKGVILNG